MDNLDRELEELKQRIKRIGSIDKKYVSKEEYDKLLNQYWKEVDKNKKLEKECERLRTRNYDCENKIIDIKNTMIELINILDNLNDKFYEYKIMCMENKNTIKELNRQLTNINRLLDNQSINDDDSDDELVIAEDVDPTYFDAMA